MSGYPAILEAIYRHERTDQLWAQGIAAAAAPVFGERGVIVNTYDLDCDNFPLFSNFAEAGTGGWAAPLAAEVHTKLPRERMQQALQPWPPALLLSECFGPEVVAAGSGEPGMEVFHEHGIFDMIGMRGTDPSGHGCTMSVLLERTKPLEPRRRENLARLAAHLAAGWRLRRALAGSAQGRGPEADAVVSPNGRLEHCSPSLTDRRAQLVLSDVVLRRERIWSAPSDVETTLDLWRALIAGRWSIVDHVENDGKRFVLARRNQPDVREPAALTRRERQVAAYAALGHSNKLIAYELGLSSTTIATHLARALEKLGLDSRRELVQVLGPVG
jgi:DNA-binding CsgD family transcriptional regulator